MAKARSKNQHEKWLSEYRTKLPLYSQFCDRLKVLLDDLLRSEKISYQVTEVRAKAVQSFADKISRDGKDYTKPFEQITDLAGCRIILYYADDVSRVGELIDREFQVDPDMSVDKASTLGPDQFGYLSLHKIARVSNARSKLPEWAPFSDLTAEIQIRTVLQHSWAAISHALQYKNQADVPIQSRRRLNRVAGLLELADQEFGALRNEKIALSRTVAQDVTTGQLKITIDAVSAKAFVRSSSELRQIVNTAMSHGIRFSPDDPVDEPGISQLVAASALTETEFLYDLQDALVAFQPSAESFFQEFTKSKLRGSTFASPSHVAAMAVIAMNYEKLEASEVVMSVGWGLDYTVRIFEAAKQTIARR